MGAGKAGPPLEPRELPASERLESWKEIANYLKRGVTTVQRWEKQEGLPVHRHHHDKLGTVYAYKPEIDAWWQKGRSRLEQQEQVSKTPPRRMRLAVMAAVAAVVVAAAGAGLWLWLGRQPVLPFEERDWILIADFDNRTGEDVLDGTLEYALERELANSRYVNVVPRQRINDALQLMERPLGTTIDSAVGREIALRDGSIRALLAGRIEKLDNTYLLSTVLVNPAGGVTVASFSEEAEGQKQVVPTLRRLAGRVRRALGEQLADIQGSEQKLEKVTTPSLRALQLFSRGSRLKEQGEYKAAEEFLRQAIAKDPDFASAHLWLAYALMNQRRLEEEYLPHMERALALSETVSEPERYFIRAGYFTLTGQLEQAAAAYEALLRLQPDHIFGVGNLGYISFRLGRVERSAQLSFRAADLRPRNLVRNVRAAQYQVRYGGESSLADTYLQRARALVSPQNEKRYPWFTAWLDLYPAYEHWLRGDVQQTLEVTSRVAQTLSSRSGQERHTYSFFYVVGALMALGQFKAAEAEIQSYTEPARSWGLANLAMLRGDTQGFLKLLRTSRSSKSAYVSGILLARAGSPSKAQEEISSAFALASQSLSLPVAEAQANHLRGEIALARGETDKAIQLLEESLDHLGTSWVTGFLLASDALARAREQQGNLERALQVLEQAAEAKTRLYSSVDGMWPAVTWTYIESRRAQLLRNLGREKEAQQIEAELRQLLALADSDHPVLLQLNQQRAAARREPPD